MTTIVIRFDVEDVDPTRQDPHEVAEELFSYYDEERRAGNARFNLAENFLECEWDA